MQYHYLINYLSRMIFVQISGLRPSMTEEKLKNNLIKHGKILSCVFPEAGVANIELSSDKEADDVEEHIWNLPSSLGLRSCRWVSAIAGTSRVKQPPPLTTDSEEEEDEFLSILRSMSTSRRQLESSNPTRISGNQKESYWARKRQAINQFGTAKGRPQDVVKSFLLYRREKNNARHDALWLQNSARTAALTWNYKNVIGKSTSDRDTLEYITTLVRVGLTLLGPVSLPLFVVGFFYQIVLVDFIKLVRINFLPVDMFTILLVWYGIWSGAVMFAIFGLTGLLYSFSVTNWLKCLRWRPEITLHEKREYFHIYRCYQVMNQIWLEPSKPLVGILLCTFAAMLNGTLYLLIRGGFQDIDPIINSGFVLLMICVVFGLFYGGIIFFQFGLGMSFSSRDCWTSFLRNGNLTRADKAFFRSCRHISMYIGIFFPAVNPTLPLIFYGFIVDMTIDLLLANP